MSNDELKTQEKQEKNGKLLDNAKTCITIILGATAIISIVNPNLAPSGLLFGIILVVIILFFDDRTKTKQDISNIKDDLVTLHKKFSDQNKKGTASFWEIVLYILIILFFLWMITQPR